MRGALGEAVAGRAVRIGVCVCVTATSVTATQDHCVFIINNEGALKNKKISKLRDHHLVAGGGALQLDEVVVRAIGCEQGTRACSKYLRLASPWSAFMEAL